MMMKLNRPANVATAAAHPGVQRALDKALEPPRVVRYSPFSPALIAEAIAKSKLEPVTKAERDELETLDAPREKCRQHAAEHSRGNVKAAWLSREGELKATLRTGGAKGRAQARQAVTAEFSEHRKAAMEEGALHARRQAEIVRTIIMRVADAVTGAAKELSSFHESPLARLLLSGNEELAAVYVEQAQKLRAHAAKLRRETITVHFNWQTVLQDFGIPTTITKKDKP